MSIVIAIDPGVNGGLAVLTESGDLIDTFRMPSVLGDGPKGRRAVSAALLADIINKSQATHAFCELVGPRNTDGVVQAWSFARTVGVIEGVLAAVGIPVTFIPPVTWKRGCDIPPGAENKDIARSRALAIWPREAHRFALKKDVDIAEACLIGHYGLRKMREARRAA